MPGPAGGGGGGGGPGDDETIAPLATTAPEAALRDAFGFPVPEDLEALYLAHAEDAVREEKERTARWDAFVAASAPAASAGGPAAAAAAALARVLPKGPIRARRIWCDDEGEEEDDDDANDYDDDEDTTASEEDDEDPPAAPPPLLERARRRRERGRRRRALDRLIVGGVPDAYRSAVWPALLRARERFPEPYYKNLLALVREGEEQAAAEAEAEAAAAEEEEDDDAEAGQDGEGQEAPPAGAPESAKEESGAAATQAAVKVHPQPEDEDAADNNSSESDDDGDGDDGGRNDGRRKRAARPPPPPPPPADVTPQQRAAWLRHGPSVLAQIDKDVPRTFPTRVGVAPPPPRQDNDGGDDGNNDDESENAPAPAAPAPCPLATPSGRASLRRVLAAYAAHRPSHGYAQGMNMWAGGLMLRLAPSDEAGVFASLCALSEDVIPGYFSPAMVSPRADQRLFGTVLLPERLPHVSAALRRLFGGDAQGDAAAAAALPGCLLSGFMGGAGALPPAACARAWDLFFYERTPAAPLRVALALLERGGRALEGLAANGGGGSGGGGGGGLGAGAGAGGFASTSTAAAAATTATTTTTTTTAGDCADAAQLLQALPASVALDGGGALVRAACGGRFCDLTGERVAEMQHAARRRLLDEESSREAERAGRVARAAEEQEERRRAASAAGAAAAREEQGAGGEAVGAGGGG